MGCLKDIRQIAYLQMKGINFTHYKKEGKFKVFYYEQTQEELEKVLVDLYKGELWQFCLILDGIKTVVFRT